MGDAGDAGRAWAGAARLFLAVAVDAGTAERIRGAVAARFPHGVPGRAVRPDAWHLTLRFLGDATAEAARRVVAAMEAARAEPAFGVTFGGLGAFPRPARASVLWLGVGEGADALRRLASLAENAARAAGFAAEGKAFTPHLTLSRLQPPRDVAGVVREPLAVAGRMAVGEVVLYRSHLGGGPARYEAVARIPLAAGTAAGGDG